MITIRREPDDPRALRTSIGGGKVAGDGNYYLIYRGDPTEILTMLRAVVAEAERELPKERPRPQG